MPSGSLILAIDQGTTSTRAIVFDESARPIGSAQQELRQIFPRSGWVEHDPVEIAESAIGVARLALEDANLTAADVASLGITNQRETTVIWERATGRPLSNAIVWQDHRTAEICNAISDAGLADDIWSRTGLILDPYFSATKMRWMLDHLPIPNLQVRAEIGDVRFGTVDSWLIDQLVRGSVNTPQDDVPHLTDVTNASRTMLFNIHDLSWEPEPSRNIQHPRGRATDSATICRNVRHHTSVSFRSRDPDNRRSRRPTRGSLRPSVFYPRRHEVHVWHRRVPVG